MQPPYGASNVLARPTIEPVANRVWVVRGGMDYAAIALQGLSGKLPRRTMNVYLIKEHDGVTMFDAGVAGMAGPLRQITERMGGSSGSCSATPTATTGAPRVRCRPTRRSTATP